MTSGNSGQSPGGREVTYKRVRHGRRAWYKRLARRIDDKRRSIPLSTRIRIKNLFIGLMVCLSVMALAVLVVTLFLS